MVPSQELVFKNKISRNTLFLRPTLVKCKRIFLDNKPLFSPHISNFTTKPDYYCTKIFLDELDNSSNSNFTTWLYPHPLEQWQKVSQNTYNSISKKHIKVRTKKISPKSTDELKNWGKNGNPKHFPITPYVFSYFSKIENTYTSIEKKFWITSGPILSHIPHKPIFFWKKML